MVPLFSLVEQVQFKAWTKPNLMLGPDSIQGLDPKRRLVLWDIADGACPPPPAIIMSTGARVPGAVSDGDIGADCVVSISVSNSSGGQASVNVLPFEPPRRMQLSAATVDATVQHLDHRPPSTAPDCSR